MRAKISAAVLAAVAMLVLAAVPAGAVASTASILNEKEEPVETGTELVLENSGMAFTSGTMSFNCGAVDLDGELTANEPATIGGLSGESGICSVNGIPLVTVDVEVPGDLEFAPDGTGTMPIRYTVHIATLGSPTCTGEGTLSVKWQVPSASYFYANGKTKMTGSAGCPIEMEVSATYSLSGSGEQFTIAKY